eukprot:CAMPEP_0201481076 /NCGR_PEP_ID=MMETSP0151_2-20130828/5402_1 /ASSEMBLY_ACC=CAM_ASM_000257 /TAXON_ID=200890 /ORGANISM="Paramoeba atlantica, Strain 621/1 / CCAP 1560/9" /LENGTH=538 /DNA_ID=CAMNT_0047863107 /DNA_START=107 /DNA_END=1723 /DNA_ORIENTATION=-
MSESCQPEGDTCTAPPQQEENEQQQQQEEQQSSESSSAPALGKYETLIKEGDDAIRLKQYTSAWKKYTAAIKLDSSKFIGYYKRAIASVQRSNANSALSDLDRVIELKPDYLQALIQRGNVLMSLGRFKDSRAQYQQVLSLSPGHALTTKKMGILANGENAFVQMTKAIRNKNLVLAMKYHTEALSTASENRFLNFLRVFFASKKHDYDQIAEAAMAMIKQDSQDVEAIVWRGISFFRLNRLEVAMKHFKEAIKYDPENKLGKTYLKRTKKYQKNSAIAIDAVNEKRWSDALQVLNDLVVPLLEEEASTVFVSKAISNDQGITAEDLHVLPETESFTHPELYRMLELLCQCQVELKQASSAIKTCSKAIGIRQDLIDAHIFRAKAKMQLEDYDSAYGDLQEVLRIDRNNRQANSLMQEVQKLQKMAKRVDYYKVLGVEKTAKPSEIKRAYRNLAKSNHPDKVAEEERDAAILKMQKVNEAYEVLRDNEKRGKYDRGEDLDERGGGSPFQGGGFPFNFHGGGFPGGGSGGGSWSFQFRH